MPTSSSGTLMRSSASTRTRSNTGTRSRPTTGGCFAAPWYGPCFVGKRSTSVESPSALAMGAGSGARRCGNLAHRISTPVETGSRMADFTELVDLAAERLGGSVLWATDDFFAEKENLLKYAEAIF